MLEPRREYFSLVECYKTVFELNGLECRDYFEFCNNNTRSNNSFKIRMKSAKVNAFKYSFFMRIIKEWNNLPHHLFGNDINSNKFKYNLKKWMNISSRMNPLLLMLLLIFYIISYVLVVKFSIILLDVNSI